MTLMVYCEVINKHAIVIVYGFLEPRSLVTTLQSMMNANLSQQMVLALPRKQAHQDNFKSINDDTPQPIHQFHVVLGPGVLVYPNPSKGLTSRLYCGCGRGIAVIVLTSMFSGGPKPLLTEFGIYHSRLETCVVYFQIRTLSNLLEVTIYNRRRKWFFF